MFGACEASGSNSLNVGFDKIRLYKRAFFKFKVLYLSINTLPFSIDENLNHDGMCYIEELCSTGKEVGYI